MTNSNGIFILIGAVMGFVCGTLVSRNYWMLTYRTYTEEMTKQYCSLLEKFGVQKNSDGYWEIKNGNNP